MKRIVMFILVFMLGLGVAVAQDQKEAGLAAWLKDLQRKIQQIMPRRSLPMETAIAGIRGVRQEQKATLYWKGKKEEEAVSEGELAKFKGAVDLAVRGERQATIKEMEAFMREFPDSPFIPDAKKTLDLVRAEETNR